MASKSMTWGTNLKGADPLTARIRNALLDARVSMGKYSYKGRRKSVEKFTTRQGLGILVAIGGILAELLLLWMLGYLQFRRARVFGFSSCVRTKIALPADNTSNGSSKETS